MKGNGIGLDIGGANLKAATADGRARSAPFELWKQPDRLGQVLRQLLDGWPVKRLAVTMTGELSDCFESKRDGVERILAEVERAFPTCGVRVWSTVGQFASIEEARADHLRVAAANWHALATWVGSREAATRRVSGAERSVTDVRLLVDIGSTTTDIIPIIDGHPAPSGRTDSTRLLSRELIYTGVRRTPICAIVPDVMAELFATSLDAYLLLGKISENVDDCNTADGRPATIRHAHARLARMLGGDGEITSLAETKLLAERVYALQQSSIAGAIGMVVARLPVPPTLCIVSGSGEFLARGAMTGVGVDDWLISLNGELGPELSTAACAYAVALLAEAT